MKTMFCARGGSRPRATRAMARGVRKFLAYYLWKKKFGLGRILGLVQLWLLARQWKPSFSVSLSALSSPPCLLGRRSLRPKERRHDTWRPSLMSSSASRTPSCPCLSVAGRRDALLGWQFLRARRASVPTLLTRQLLRAAQLLSRQGLLLTVTEPVVR
jgi:hypothetical protein